MTSLCSRFANCSKVLEPNIYIYIYIERERERERETYVDGDGGGMVGFEPQIGNTIKNVVRLSLEPPKINLRGYVRVIGIIRKN